MHSLDLDRGPTPLPPFAADFVGDAVDMTRGAIGAEGGSGFFAAATALAAVTVAVLLLAAASMLTPVVPVTAATAPAPLVTGARVPDLSFEVEWQADDCQPFGLYSPRYDGRVRLTLCREDRGP